MVPLVGVPPRLDGPILSAYRPRVVFSPVMDPVCPFLAIKETQRPELDDQALMERHAT
ncbi:hypothetical protein H1235_08010 [Pseudoxanthomonas sp. NC8]|nr:hypothetical protein H1235_08010 [Pseudoxanthomonas sp. NC8]